MLRACGGLCLKMVAEYHLSASGAGSEGDAVPDILTLCNEAKERGGYHLQNGWVHDYLVTKAQELGLEAHREENITDLSKIKEFLASGNPVIVSVEKRVLEQTRFHMVVLVGFGQSLTSRTGADLADSTSSVSTGTSRLTSDAYFIYHETESTDKEKGKFRKVSEEQFLEYFRGKAIFVSRK